MKAKSTILKLFILIAVCGLLFNNNISAGGYTTQDWENPTFPPAGWSLANTSTYNWVRTGLCGGYGLSSTCAVCDFYDYASGNFDLITTTLPLTVSGDSLVFDHAYAPASTENDQLSIYTSNNNGATWVLLINLQGGTGGPLRTAPAFGGLFVPTSSQWATKRYVLPTGTNKIKFTGISAYGNNLYLDNIKVGASYNNDVGANAIPYPKYAITPGSQAPKATVKNYGTTTQSFQVTMTINPGGYSNTQAVTNLAAGQTTQLTFSNFGFATNGTYTIKAFSTLGGDQNIANDTMTSTVIVTPAPRNVVLEYCTGTWCQYCPCGDRQADNLRTAYPNSVVIAYHGPLNANDPWTVFNGSNIIGLFGWTGYPSGLIDRRLGANNAWGAFCVDGENRMTQSPVANVNIALTTFSYNTGSRVLTVNLDATALATLSGQYKITYIISEDNIVYNQTGTGICPGSSSWVHNNIVRNIVNGAAGENLNSGTWNSGQVISKNFTTTIDPTWLSGNCKLQVIVYKDNGSLNTSEVQQGLNSGPIDLTGINNQNSGIPKSYVLSQNYPNPFNPTTYVHISLPKDGSVTLKLYNTLGQEVGTYLDGFIKAGNYNAEIDASNLASGTYFYTLKADDFVQTKKMILVK